MPGRKKMELDWYTIIFLGIITLACFAIRERETNIPYDPTRKPVRKEDPFPKTGLGSGDLLTDPTFRHHPGNVSYHPGNPWNIV